MNRSLNREEIRGEIVERLLNIHWPILELTLVQHLQPDEDIEDYKSSNTNDLLTRCNTSSFNFVNGF
jgi:hypothetical protein